MPLHPQGALEQVNVEAMSSFFLPISFFFSFDLSFPERVIKKCKFQVLTERI